VRVRPGTQPVCSASLWSTCSFSSSSMISWCCVFWPSPPPLPASHSSSGRSISLRRSTTSCSGQPPSAKPRSRKAARRSAPGGWNPSPWMIAACSMIRSRSAPLPPASSSLQPATQRFTNRIKRRVARCRGVVTSSASRSPSPAVLRAMSSALAIPQSRSALAAASSRSAVRASFSSMLSAARLTRLTSSSMLLYSTIPATSRGVLPPAHLTATLARRRPARAGLPRRATSSGAI
jgi:hypothetical protein